MQKVLDKTIRNYIIYEHSKIERHNVFTGETNKIVSTSVHDKKYKPLI